MVELENKEGLILGIANKIGFNGTREEALQAGEIGIFKASKSYKADFGTFGTWAFYHIRKALFVEKKKNKRVEFSFNENEDGEVEEFAAEEKSDFSSIELSEMREFVESLGKEDRFVIEGIFYKGLTRRDVARRLGKKCPGSIDYIQNRAFAALKKMYEEKDK